MTAEFRTCAERTVLVLVGMLGVFSSCGQRGDDAAAIPPAQSASNDPGDAASEIQDGSSTSASSDGDGGGCVPPPSAGFDASSSSSSSCDAPLTPGSDRKCSLTTASGESREYLLYAPTNYNPCHATALVVDAHGSSETDREQAGLDPFMDWPSGLGSGWRLVADREGFVVAQPQGLSNQWTEADADLMVQIVSEVNKIAKVDAQRVYMTGISNGGGLTYWTGCKHTDVFHGFAAVSGYGPSTCPVTKPAPLIHFHSPDDKLVSYADGQQAFQLWVTNNHCKAGPTDTMRFGGPQSDPDIDCLTTTTTTTATGNAGTTAWQLAACDKNAPETSCQTWTQCDGNVDATFCTVAPDNDHHFDTTGGHILYINATKLSLAAVAWAYLEKPR